MGNTCYSHSQLEDFLHLLQSEYNYFDIFKSDKTLIMLSKLSRRLECWFQQGKWIYFVLMGLQRGSKHFQGI